MNIKIKAAAITAGLLFAAIAASEIIRLAAANFTKEQISDGIAWVCMSILVFCMYKVVLIQLEMRKFKD